MRLNRRSEDRAVEVIQAAEEGVSESAEAAIAEHGRLGADTTGIDLTGLGVPGKGTNVAAFLVRTLFLPVDSCIPPVASRGRERERALDPSSPEKDTNPITGPTLMTSSTSQGIYCLYPDMLSLVTSQRPHLHPNTITLGIKASTYECGGGMNIQSTAVTKKNF